MWELDYKDSWVLKNWCFWTVVLEKTLESPLDCKEIQLVHPKGNQSWIVIGRTDAEAEIPILWPPDLKNWLIGKHPDAGKDWRWEEKGMTKDERVGWHHQLNGREFEQALGVGDGQGSLACCSLWGHKESDTTENWLKSTSKTRTKKVKHYWRHWEADKHEKLLFETQMQSSLRNRPLICHLFESFSSSKTVPVVSFSPSLDIPLYLALLPALQKCFYLSRAWDFP